MLNLYYIQPAVESTLPPYRIYLKRNLAKIILPMDFRESTATQYLTSLQNSNVSAFYAKMAKETSKI